MGGLTSKRGMVFRGLFTAAAAVGLSVASAKAGVVYSNDFQSGVGGLAAGGVLSSLSTTSLPTDGGGLGSANQSKWLGRVGEGVAKGPNSVEAVDLKLTGLTPGASYTVAFDLLIGASWDGGASSGYGSDAWYFSAGGTRLVDTMFSNGDQGIDYGAYSPQRYTDSEYTNPNSADVKAFTGAEYFRKDGPGYSGYYGIYYFSHGTGNPVLTFVATDVTADLEWARYSPNRNFGDSADEYWALDNIVVAGVPEPTGAAILVCGGALALLARRRRL